MLVEAFSTCCTKIFPSQFITRWLLTALDHSCATKAAVRSYTEILRKELIATRIRVIEIAAGQVETEFSVVRFGGDKAKADAVYAGVEPCTAEDIAEVVVFAAGRRENMVLADALLFPNHQVGIGLRSLSICLLILFRQRLRFCIGGYE